MRILMVVSEFPALSETFVLDQITSLIDRGHQVDVLAMRPKAEKIIHGQVEKYQLKKNVYYAYTGTKNKVIWFLIKSFFLNISKGNFRLIFGAMASAVRKAINGNRALLNPFYFYVYGFRLNEIQRPDVTVCHFGPNGDLMVQLRSALALKFPIAIFFHGNDISECIAVRGSRIYDDIFRAGDLFLPVSDFFRERLLELGCPAQKTFVQRMGIDLKLFPSPQQEAGQSVKQPATFKFLSIGRMVEKKGHAVTIRAFAKCKAKYSNATMSLIIIGDGPLRSQIESLISSLDLASHVHLAGALPRDKVFRHLVDAQAFVLPSVTGKDGDMEGFPVSILEAMAMELPVLSTKHSGIPELVDDGVNGFLVKEHDVEALADRMGSFIEDPPLAKKMGKMGRVKVVNESSLDYWNEILADRLEELIS